MYQKFKQGIQLPYDVLDIHNIPDGAKAGNFIEIRCGGFGSEISPHPTEKNQKLLVRSQEKLQAFFR